MNPKRYTWSKVAYENVAKKVLEFRQKLDQVTVEEICKILEIPPYMFTRLGNEKYWFIDISPKYWKVLRNAVNNLHIEGNVIKDHRETPVKVITIDDLKTKKGRGRKKSEDDSSPDDFKVKTYQDNVPKIDPKHRDKEIHIVSPKDESEINPKDQEAFMDRTDPVIADFVKKETTECTPEDKKSSESFLKLRIGNFKWVDKEKGLVKFVEDSLGNFKIVDDQGLILPIWDPRSGGERYRSALGNKEISDMYKKKGINVPGTPDAHSLPAKVELTAKALMTIDDQVRRIIKEEIPIMIEDCISNLKFQIELPIRINT